MSRSVPNFFVYGEDDKPLDVGFIHVETVMARKNIHLGVVEAHQHTRMAQITFWTSGRGSYFIEDQILDFLAPAVSFVPSGVVHGFTIDPNGTDAIVVSVADSALAPIRSQTSLSLDVPSFLTAVGRDSDWARLAQLLHQIHDEYRERRPDSERVISSLIAVVLTEIARFDVPSSFDTGGQFALANAFRRLVDRHFSDNWPVERYVDELGSTPHLLSKACYSSFGLSMKEFISERRLLEAKRLLLFTVRSHEEIAFEIGLRDPAYFSRFFRQHVGTSPSMWRSERLAVQNS